MRWHTKQKLADADFQLALKVAPPYGSWCCQCCKRFIHQLYALAYTRHLTFSWAPAVKTIVRCACATTLAYVQYWTSHGKICICCTAQMTQPHDCLQLCHPLTPSQGVFLIDLCFINTTGLNLKMSEHHPTHQWANNNWECGPLHSFMNV